MSLCLVSGGGAAGSAERGLRVGSVTGLKVGGGCFFVVSGIGSGGAVRGEVLFVVLSVVGFVGRC